MLIVPWRHPYVRFVHLIGNLSFDSRNLLSEREVVVEFGLYLALRRELCEQEIQEIEKAIMSVADFHDAIWGEVLLIFQSVKEEKIFDTHFLPIVIVIL